MITYKTNLIIYLAKIPMNNLSNNNKFWTKAIYQDRIVESATKIKENLNNNNRKNLYSNLDEEYNNNTRVLYIEFLNFNFWLLNIYLYKYIFYLFLYILHYLFIFTYILQ